MFLHKSRRQQTKIEIQDTYLKFKVQGISLLFLRGILNTRIVFIKQ